MITQCLCLAPPYRLAVISGGKISRYMPEGFRKLNDGWNLPTSDSPGKRWMEPATGLLSILFKPKVFHH